MEWSAIQSKNIQNSLRNRQVAIQSFWRYGKKLGKINCSSGFFITDQYIVSSAHNFYIDQNQSIATDVRIILNQENQNLIDDSNLSFILKLKQGQNIFIEFYVNQSNIKTYKIDLAIIKTRRLKIQSNIIKTLFGIYIMPNEKLKVIVSGHPDLTAKEAEYIKKKIQCQRKDVFTNTLDINGNISKITNNFIYYKTQNPTISGQSGGPIILEYEKNYYIVGIHIEYSSSIKTGKGIVFSKQVCQLMERWMGVQKDSIQSKIAYQQYNNIRHNMFKIGKRKELQIKIEPQKSENEKQEGQQEQNQSFRVKKVQIGDKSDKMQKIEQILYNINKQISVIRRALKEMMQQIQTLKQIKIESTPNRSFLINESFQNYYKLIKDFSQKMQPLLQEINKKNNYYLQEHTVNILGDQNNKKSLQECQEKNRSNLQGSQQNDEFYNQMKQIYEQAFTLFDYSSLKQILNNGLNKKN